MKSIFVEFLEIYIIQVIYLRGLYPRQIFRKHKAYCLPVYCSIYPPLNDYLKGALKSIQHLLEIKQLNKIEILIYNEDDSRESFVINILEEFSIADTDKYLMKLHELFRQSIYNLDIKVKALSKFKRSSRFKILLHTKEKAYQKLCIDSKYQVRVLLNDEGKY